MPHASAQQAKRRIGRAEIALAAALAVLSGCCLAISATRPSVAPAIAGAAAPQVAASSSAAEKSQTKDVKPPRFVPTEKNRSVESIAALFSATGWAASYAGDSERNEEALRATLVFEAGAYVAESKIYKGHYCLYMPTPMSTPKAAASDLEAASSAGAPPGQAQPNAEANMKEPKPALVGDACDVDGLAVAAGVATPALSELESESVRDLATAAQFNAAYDDIQARGGLVAWVGDSPAYGAVSANLGARNR